ncbi:hypothetical protein RRG08_030207 [Elysia crispata]|uniref:Uncharacterized protein n=1 Tax=Elysia crispata TaxID=231223 RepID=A0AAE1E3K1_9GAST|nr:hypothetical protein RRG08_030207 [Elysia crispata]
MSLIKQSRQICPATTNAALSALSGALYKTLVMQLKDLQTKTVPGLKLSLCTVQLLSIIPDRLVTPRE